jgi:lipopolysaccharide/colanic/teichoic acid biosynthesis glycosyltransferase
MTASEFQAELGIDELRLPSSLHVIADVTTPVPQLRYHGWQRYLKRALDIIVTLAVLPVALPLMLAIAILIRRDSAGPALFRQERIGQGGRRFRMLKFRTMYLHSEERLAADPELYALYVAHDFKLPNRLDPRVTRLGRFLRHSSLDELPQLFNVLGGSMSLVGPRPILLEQLAGNPDAIPSYLQLRPGITGKWQVGGSSQIKYPERGRLDEEYLDNWNVSTDLVILAKTIPHVLRRRGCEKT